MERLEKQFYEQPSLELTEQLPGKNLYRQGYINVKKREEQLESLKK
jgi:hypothetical protein